VLQFIYFDEEIMLLLNRQYRRNTMQHIHRRLWVGALLACLAVATLVLPAHAGVRVSIGVGVPVDPAPVLVAPPPVVLYGDSSIYCLTYVQKPMQACFLLWQAGKRLL
jgi:hypothetical protein